MKKKYLIHLIAFLVSLNICKVSLQAKNSISGSLSKDTELNISELDSETDVDLTFSSDTTLTDSKDVTEFLSRLYEMRQLYSFLASLSGIGEVAFLDREALRLMTDQQFENTVHNPVKPVANDQVLEVSLAASGRDNTTVVVDVYSPATGRIWMDRNLGASRVATSSTDFLAYGDLYQWGRGADGHQKRNSPTTLTLSSSDQPGHGSFIKGSSFDWRSPRNDNLWQGVNGINNPCPQGYRLPTELEWNAEIQSWSSNNATGAFDSPLKLPLQGSRWYYDASFYNVDISGFYWSSTLDGIYAMRVSPDSDGVIRSSVMRSIGLSVRCIKDEMTTVLPTDPEALFRFKVLNVNASELIDHLVLRSFQANGFIFNEILISQVDGFFSVFTQDFPSVFGNSVDIYELLLKSSNGTLIGRVKLNIRIPTYSTASTLRDLAGFDAILYLHEMDSGWRNGSRWEFFESEDEFPVTMLIPPNKSFDSISPNQTPLLFVHGVGGTYPYWNSEFSSTDWNNLYEQYDPWQFYYPYDMDIEKAGNLLGNALYVLSGSSSGAWSLGYSANRIHVAAHSMGGLVARSHILENPSNNRIEKLLMLGTPNHGSYSSWRLRNTNVGNTVGWFTGKDRHAPAYEQMAPGSPFYQSLNTHLPRLGSVNATTDYLVMAGTRSRLSRPTQEIKNQDDEVVSLSSASLLKYGAPLVTFDKHHTEIKNPGVVNILSFFSNNYQPSENRFSGHNGFWSQSASGVPPTGSIYENYDITNGKLTVNINSNDIHWSLLDESNQNLKLYPSVIRKLSDLKLANDISNHHHFFFKEKKIVNHYLGIPYKGSPYQVDLGKYTCNVFCRWIRLHTYENLNVYPLNHNHWDISISGDHLLVLGGSGVGSSTAAGKIMALSTVTETESSWFIDASVDSVAFTLISVLEDAIDEENFNLSLQTPSGTTITSGTAQNNENIIFYENIADGFGYYFIRNPEEGIWTLTHNQPPESVELSANAASEIVLVASSDQDSYEKGDAARVWIRAASDSDDSPSISVEAFYRGQNATEFTGIGSLSVSFDEEEGRFYTDVNLDMAGEYRFQIIMSAQANGNTIERTQRVEIESIELHVLPDVTLLSPAMNATGVSTMATFEWEAVEGANYYQIQIVEDGADFTDDELLIGLFVEETSAEISGFSINSNYEWRIRAFGDGSASGWSESGHFTTAAGLWMAAYGQNWNLVGIPVETFNSNVSHLFPQNSSGSVFAFEGAYRSEQHLVPGNGYWLNMPESGFREIEGDIIGEMDIDLNKGWNLISGTYHPVQLWAIDDPGSVITTGSIFGFDETYFFAGSLQPGRGYWVHAEQPGTISIRTQQGKLQPAIKEWQLRDIAGHKIQFQSGVATQERYFAVENTESISSSNILPPTPPKGMLDTRIIGDQWFTKDHQVKLLIQHPQEELKMILHSPEEDFQLYSYNVELISDNHVIRKLILDEGEALIVGKEIDEIVIRLESISDVLDHRGDLPMEFNLDQNYPNPFNPSTLIRFALPEQSNVRLDVFNVIGQRVATLINGELNAGWHQVTFDGSHLSSGMYIYRIQAGNFVQTRKLVLVK